MQNDLLEKARQQAEKSDPSVRAAALLRIARAESADADRARPTLLQALDAVRELPNPVRNYLLNEARAVAAAVAPDLLAEIPIGRHDAFMQFASGNIVQVMLAHGHTDAAFDYLMHYDDLASFPSLWVGNVLHQLDPPAPNSEDRRLKLLRHTFEMCNQGPSGMHFHERDHFVRLFGDYWKDFPVDEALALTHTLVARAAEEPDNGGSFGYPDEIHFTSPRQNTLFELLHVLRRLDPALAQSLIVSHDQLALAARRYPNGIETMNEEAEAEAVRRKAEGQTCGGGYIVSGSDRQDIDRKIALLEATCRGDFEPSFQDVLEKYHEDTAPETHNYAPKEYWPSTGAFRTLFYQAGKQLGSDAIEFLERVPDDSLRLFATIELAAALAGVPASSITQMKQPRPVDPRLSQNCGITSVRPSLRSGTGSSRMRCPDGRLIRCPKCLFVPAADLCWVCKCGHVWNTFSTAGKCPACHFQWEVTACPHCGEMSQHRAWYESEE